MKTLSLLLLLLTFGWVSAQAQQVHMNDKKIANNGYDVVNYFTTYTAARGSADFSTSHNGATYYFVNADHLKKFKEDPERYLPQFGGYCAFGAAKAMKIASDPEMFRIDDGKLYLFYNDYWEGKPFNAILPWLNDEAEMEKKAVENWKTME